MTARRKQGGGETVVELTPDVEVTEAEEQQSEKTPEVLGEFPAAPVIDAEHVKELVALFVDQQMAEIKQELADLRMLLMQPKGAVEIEQTTVYREGSGDGVPWYTPSYREPQ